MALFAISIIYILGIITSGVFMTKLIDQRARDRQRQTMLLSLPAGLETERVLSWVRSVSGTLRPRGFRLTGAPSLAFEMWATHEGIVHRLKIPWQHADYVQSQLHTLVPGISLRPDAEYPYETAWTRAIEARLTGSSRTLRIYSAEDTAASILASVTGLKPGETALLQWVVTPCPPRVPPVADDAKSDEVSIWTLMNGGQASRDEIADRRKKLEEPNYMAVLRVAAEAGSRARADQLIHRIHASLAATRAPGTRFEKRLITNGAVQRRINEASGSMVYPIQLSASELTALIAWPIGSPFVAGLAPSRTRPLAPSASIPSDGRLLGVATMAGNSRPVAVSYDGATRHSLCVGPTGVGKTTALANMMAQDMNNDHGIILIEAKGDLFWTVLDLVPEHRIKDVVVVDINDTEFPVGFNILDQGNSRNAIDELSMLIGQLYKDASVSIHAPQMLYHMMHALAEVPGSTFIDLQVLLSPAPPNTPEAVWRDNIARQVKSRDIRTFLQRYLDMLCLRGFAGA